MFQGEGVAGGAADTEVGDENYGIITQGNNLFDHNAYRALDPSLRIRIRLGHTDKAVRLCGVPSIRTGNEWKLLSQPK